MNLRFWILGALTLLVLGFALGLTTGCSRSEEAPVAERRIVSLGGSVTEILYQLGAAGEIVGTDTTSIYPEEAAALPKVGYQRQLSAEGVLSLAPTLIIGTDDAGPPHVVEQLRTAGIEMILLPLDKSPEGLNQLMAGVAEAMDASDQVEPMQQAVSQHWEQVAKISHAMVSKPKVLFIYARGGGVLNVSGTDTAAHAVIGLVGGENAVTGYKGYRPLTAEALVEAKPEVILISSEGMESLGGEDALWALPGMNLTPAYEKKQVLTESIMPLLGFGPRSPETLAKLAQALASMQDTASQGATVSAN